MCYTTTSKSNRYSIDSNKSNISIEHPTRYLDFKILDGNGTDVPVKKITIQLLNKVFTIIKYIHH